MKTEAEKSTSDSGNSDKGQGDPQPGGPADKNENSSTVKTRPVTAAPEAEGEAVRLVGKDSYDGGIYNGDPVSAGGDLQVPAMDQSPVSLLRDFDTDPGTVKAGSNFKLVIHLKNTSKKTAVTNMLFDLQRLHPGDG